jgi:hypothetical protein
MITCHGAELPWDKADPLKAIFVFRARRSGPVHQSLHVKNSANPMLWRDAILHHATAYRNAGGVSPGVSRGLPRGFLGEEVGRASSARPHFLTGSKLEARQVKQAKSGALVIFRLLPVSWFSDETPSFHPFARLNVVPNVGRFGG